MRSACSLSPFPTGGGPFPNGFLLAALQLLENWYGDDTKDKGILLVLSAMEDGALVGGEKFMSKFDGDFQDSLVGDTIAYWSRQEKPNRAVLASMERIMAIVNGQEDPGERFGRVGLDVRSAVARCRRVPVQPCALS